MSQKVAVVMLIYTTAMLLVGILEINLRLRQERRAKENLERRLADTERRLVERTAYFAEMWSADLNGEHLRDFDRILSSLPTSPEYAPHFRQYLHREELWAYKTADIPASVVCTMLDFDAVQLRLNGRRLRGWRRGDWVILPAELIR